MAQRMVGDILRKIGIIRQNFAQTNCGRLTNIHVQQSEQVGWKRLGQPTGGWSRAGQVMAGFKPAFT